VKTLIAMMIRASVAEIESVCDNCERMLRNGQTEAKRDMKPFVGGIRAIRSLARPLAMVAIWMTATAFFGLAYFLSGRRVRVDEAIVFTMAFAGAAAVSAVIALAIGTKRRWALEAALPMATLMFSPVAIAWALSWLAPSTTWNLQRVDFFPYGGHVTTAVLGIARQTVPTGAVVGASFGTIVGLLILLVRHRPRLARCLVVALLLACVIGSVHVVAFDHVVDFVVKTRLAGVNHLRVSWTIRLELASAIGATAGAFVGAVGAYGAVRLRDGSRRSRPMSEHGNVE
jgi:hypothetical protein